MPTRAAGGPDLGRSPGDNVTCYPPTSILYIQNVIEIRTRKPKDTLQIKTSSYVLILWQCQFKHLPTTDAVLSPRISTACWLGLSRSASDKSFQRCGTGSLVPHRFFTGWALRDPKFSGATRLRVSEHLSVNCESRKKSKRVFVSRLRSSLTVYIDAEFTVFSVDGEFILHNCCT